jgi:RsmE family RNA methyltransferase
MSGARVNHEWKAVERWVDLVLAPPRPRVMKRLLPQLAAMGVGKIFLVGAKKVEKDFWGATLLKEENYRPLLIDGLMQAGTTILPQLEIRRNFKRFVTDELESVFPNVTRRVVAHPYKANGQIAPSKDKLLLAVGPEGGWTEEEVELLQSHAFLRYSLGGRILRSDTALIALLARLGE